MTDWKPGATIKTLRQRADLIKQIRAFFEKRNVLEVETPSISRFPAVDLHLDSFSVKAAFDSRTSYLITSPEYHMKRLLAAGSGSIFQICKAFRSDESGSRHNPEFTILEWYRKGWDHWQLMKEIDCLLQQILKTSPATYLSYKDAFKNHLDIDPLAFSMKDFETVCSRKKSAPPADLLRPNADRDEQLNYLMGTFIEPELGKESPLFLHDYPASQANLAKLYEDKTGYAMRFEVYYRGTELGNGFCELTDPETQQQRFEEENRARLAMGKEELAIDHNFLDALKAGMPECAGVAMGVDRMLMLALGIENLDGIVAFSWPRA
ncbi:MAG: elongation factor P--(R)-beta-lysine ligase [Proteobacteria bacterium]|nr:elongation factor P--(R)-beta-lysine ligase [Pseudomonadota bacterium]